MATVVQHVARLCLGERHDVIRRSVLVIRRTTNLVTRRAVTIARQARAVEAARIVAAPHIGHAQETFGNTQRRGVRRAAATRRAAGGRSATAVAIVRGRRVVVAVIDVRIVAAVIGRLVIGLLLLLLLLLLEFLALALSLGLGLQYTLDNIRLADSGITLGNIGGRLVPVALDEPADKSKAVTSSLGIPVRLIYEPVKRLRITAVAYSDFMLGADAIYKKPKEKHSLSGFRAYQFGLGASVAYRGFGLYARYGITPLFKHDAGPDCHTVSFGFAYSLSL